MSNTNGWRQGFDNVTDAVNQLAAALLNAFTGNVNITGDVGITGVLRIGGLAVAPVFYTPEIDLTAVGLHTMIAPMPFRVARGTGQWICTAKDGTVTTGPTFSTGTNAATYDNQHASQVGLFTAAGAVPGTLVTTSGINAPVAASDLTTSGWKVNVTSGAVLGTATVLRARFYYYGPLLPV